MKVKKLRKYYNRGVECVSFEVKKGEVFGLIGPNGTGKTTTIRNILGIIKPNAGEIEIDGCRVSEELSSQRLIPPTKWLKWLEYLSIFTFIPLVDTVINGTVFVKNSIVIMIVGLAVLLVAGKFFEKMDVIV